LRAPYPALAEIEAVVGKADSTQTHADKDILGRITSRHYYTWKVVRRPQEDGKQDELCAVFEDNNSRANGIMIYRDFYFGYSNVEEEFIGRESQHYLKRNGSSR
jgi:hypothetical protein